MARDSAETRQRIFEAASDEFAAHGIAGARIDRIARAAGANKQLIYAYFGGKEELFATVVGNHITRFIEDVPFDPADLPRHAGDLFEFYVQNPRAAQLAAWHALEPGETKQPIALIQRAFRDRVRLVDEAQAQGVIDRSIGAADLLALVATIARAFATPAPETQVRGRSRARDARRAAVETAVKRLVWSRNPEP